MVFWMAVGVGALFIWIGVQVGFYATWTMFFNLVLSAYVALFLTPLVITSVPAATETAYGYALVLMCVAIATLMIAYGLTFACLSGQLRAYFPKAFDSVGAGFLGFLNGFLVLSFVAFAFSLTPLCRPGDPQELSIFKTLGFEAQSQETNTSYVCFWCNRMNGLLGYSDSQLKNSQMAVKYLLNKASPPPVPPAVVAPAGGEATGGAPDGGAAAPPAPPGLPGTAVPATPTAPPTAPPDSISPFEAVPDKSAKPGASQAPPKATGNPVAAAPAQPGGNTPPVSAVKPSLPPLGDGPLSGVWQTQQGAQFRISDDKKAIAVDGMESTVLQSFSGKLSRAGGSPDAKILTGTFDAAFTIDSHSYTIDVTMTVVNSNMLNLRCTNWPKWNNKGKLLGRDLLTVTWLRAPDAPVLDSASAEGSAP
jgi:hypothetical protein